MMRIDEKKSFIAILSLLFILINSGGLKATAQKAEDYLPLIPHMRYSYRGVFRRETYKQTIVSREARKGDFKATYFMETKDIDNPFGEVGSNMIGLGALTIKPDGIYTLRCTYASDVGGLSKKEQILFLRTPLRKGDTVRNTLKGYDRYNNADVVVTVTVLGFEPVSVPAGAFQDAVKIHIRTAWVTNTYDSYAWLAKGVGLVKWIRDTGRVDELLSYGSYEVQPLTANAGR